MTDDRSTRRRTHSSEVYRLIASIEDEQDEFRAFLAGVGAAFQHEGAFEDCDDFEAWLKGEWANYREEKDD